MNQPDFTPSVKSDSRASQPVACPQPKKRYYPELVVPKLPLLVPVPAGAPSVPIPDNFSRPTYLEMAQKALGNRKAWNTYYVAVFKRGMPGGLAFRFPRPDGEDGFVFMVREAAAQREIDELHKIVADDLGQPLALFPLDLMDEEAKAPVGVVEGVTYADGAPLLVCGIAATVDEDGHHREQERPSRKLARPLSPLVAV